MNGVFYFLRWAVQSARCGDKSRRKTLNLSYYNRRLAVEALERRSLLSVTATDLTFKTLIGSFSGNFTGSYVDAYGVLIHFDGTAGGSGSATYSSNTVGIGTTNVSGTANWWDDYGDGGLTPFSIISGGIQDNDGVLTGSGGG